MPHADDVTPDLPTAELPAVLPAATTTVPGPLGGGDPGEPGGGSPRTARRRRRLPAVLAITLAVTAAGAGVAAVVDAHKTVLLDVQGEVVEVSTFADSVERLLEARDIVLGEHDTVTPALDRPLRDGADVVVRRASEVVVETDGEQSTLWIAALDADDALRQLASSRGDVRLVPSRSAERPELPLPLSAPGETVAIVADGQTQALTYEGTGLAALLEGAGVDVAEPDLVSVVVGSVGSADAAVTVVIQRVVTQDETTTTALPYTRTERRDDRRFSDLGPRVEQAGVEGVRTVVERVTTVDGVETERVPVSEEEVPPVDEIVAVGTRARPAPRPAPAPAPAASSGSSGSGVSEDVWVRLAQCESGGRPDVVSPGGRFHGLYQFSVATWRSVGGEGLPSQASPAEQRLRAEILQARSGWGQWPACSRRLGLR